MQGVKSGIDGVNLTFPVNIEPQAIIECLFPILDFNKHFKSVINTGMPKALKKIQWYGMSYYCQNSEGDVLMSLHTMPQSCFGKRNLLQIHGLVFSDFSTNPFRPLDLHQLITSTLTLNGIPTSLDIYLDDFSGITPVEDVYVQSLPHNYRRHIRSVCVQNKQGMSVFPRIENNGIYFGLKRGNNLKVLFYQKNKDPRQGINDDTFGTKFKWTRWELRLRADTAKTIGLDLLQSIAANPENTATAISSVFKKYFNFILPDSKRLSRCSTQPWWLQLLKCATC